MNIKKIYLKTAIMLTFLTLISSFANAGSLSISSGESDSAVGMSVNDNSGISGSADSISSNNIISINSDLLIPQAHIVSEFLDPINVNTIINIKGWVNNPKDPEVAFEWHFGDGEIYSGRGSGQPFSCDTKYAYKEIGTYKITLYLILDDSILAEDSIQITVGEIQSSISAGGPYLGVVGERIWLKVGPSSDFFGNFANIVSYDWNFGDGSFGSGSQVSHRYSNPGVYTVTLTATDDMGNIAIGSTTVTIAKVTITIHPANPVKGEKVNFGVEVIGFTPSEYYWRFGDGSGDIGQSVTHEYSDSKTYYGSISFGETNDISSNFVSNVAADREIDNKKPVSHFLVSGTSNLFEFDASTSYDRDGKIVLYEWYFGDGKMIITRNAKCSYAFGTPGNWKVKCIVIDNDGDFDSSSRTVTVSPGGQLHSASDSSLSDQEGVLYAEGVLGVAKTTTKLSSETFGINTLKPCDLDISADIESGLSESEDSIKIEVAISDLSGKYDAENVDIQLISNIPGYEIFNIDAELDQNSGKYCSIIEIPYSSSDAKSYAIFITAIPEDGYYDTDQSENSWSFTAPEETSISSNVIVSRDITSGVIAL